MTNHIQYLIDEKGKKTSVVVPFSDWEKLNSKYEKLINKMEILMSVKEGILEVKRAKKNGQKLQSLTDFLNECRS